MNTIVAVMLDDRHIYDHVVVFGHGAVTQAMMRLEALNAGLAEGLLTREEAERATIDFRRAA